MGKADSSYLRVFYKGDLDAGRLQLHWDMLLALQNNMPVHMVRFRTRKSFCLSGEDGENCRHHSQRWPASSDCANNSCDILHLEKIVFMPSAGEKLPAFYNGAGQIESRSLAPLP